MTIDIDKLSEADRNALGGSRHAAARIDKPQGIGRPPRQPEMAPLRHKPPVAPLDRPA
ncbi:hypothetical protein N2599_29190 (plasmid) [Rhizobium sullae]|uniref:Uncharacterized protein n=1 Tax=Rhizobium sullae TaxID=50338 RepID=A0ABY5XRK6_RHISU|nr:hypothetical protein [Rhizobium sullae]UWU16891.1 hypothetical protein N2599_29190 [Rhizobium sullae]